MNALLIPYKNTPENADLVARGEIELIRHGKPSRRLSKTELAEYESAKARHYLITRGRYRESSESLLKAYYGWCEATNQPTIVVYVARTLAVVDADLISMYPGSYLTPEAQLRVDAVYRSLPSRCDYFIGLRMAWSCVFERVPLDLAYTAAESLFRIISTTEILAERPHVPEKLGVVPP